MTPSEETRRPNGRDAAIDRDPSNVFFRCVEDCNEAIMLTDHGGRLTYVNPAWQRIYGFSEAESIGRTPRILHSGHQSPEFYRRMWSEILDPEKGFWKGELINRAKDGTLIPVLLTITPFKSFSGEILGHMSIALDLSNSRELEAKIVHQDRLASIGLLASGLAHEVGTPLGVVRGRAEFLMMKAEDAIVKKNLDVIIAQIDRISKLIRSLLRVSRSFSDVRLEEIPVRQVAEEVVLLIGQNANQDNVKIELDIPPGLSALADFGRLEQVLLNLVMNSIHAIRKAIQDGNAGPHSLRISAGARNSKVAIEVSDSGCGISPENMKKLFKPFFTTKDVGQGTGLGLAIVAQIVRELRGEITVQSVPGQGATFAIVLDGIPGAGTRAGTGSAETRVERSTG